ncbi:hypothetical protein MBLNU457_7305t1 [Dothideomycetes sp. NU457]
MTTLTSISPSFQALYPAAIISCAAVSGAIACFSYAGIAAIDLAPPATRLQIYAKMYRLGKKLMPPVAGSSSLVLFVLAGSSYYHLSGCPRQMLQTGMFAAAGIVTSLIAPFTVFVMKNCNGRLHELAAKHSGGEKDDMSLSEIAETEELLAQWIKLNYLRACLPLVGSVLAALAPLSF